MDQKPSTKISELTRKNLLEMPALNEVQAGLIAVIQFLDEFSEKLTVKEE